MHALDYPPRPVIAVMNAAAQPISGVNQKTFTRLKMSLRLNLRRQIFLAVCDDLELRGHLAAKLQQELAPAFVSLNLNLADPNPLGQVSQWMHHHPSHPALSSEVGVQILGIEHLMRQPAPVQKRFLTHLQAIEYYMPALDGSVLLWVPRPWLRSIQQSAPTFWEWHTALFEFEGDPTPLRVVTGGAAAMPKAAPTDTELDESDPELRSAQPAIAHLSLSAIAHDATPKQPDCDRAPEPPSPLPPPPPPTETGRLPIPTIAVEMAEFEAAEFDTAEFEEPALIRASEGLPDSLWDILTQDLAQLDDLPVPASPTPAHSPQAGASPVPAIAAVAAPVPHPRVTSAPPVVSPPPAPRPSTPTPLPAAIALAAPLRRLLSTALQTQPHVEQHQAAWASLQHIDQLQQQAVPRETIAQAYYALGRAYRETLEQEEQPDTTLAIAIAAHEQTLAVLPDGSPLRADVANDLGNLYWMKARQVTVAEEQVASLQQAIRAYHLALTHTNRVTHTATCAMIQNNLGSAYSDLAQYRDPARYLQQAIHAYEASLQVRSPQTDADRYAATQNNLGTACWNLAQHEQPLVWLQRAIAAYQSALRYYTPATEALSYAMIQNNMGTAYWNLAHHRSTAPAGSSLPTSAQLLHLAIAAYQHALTYRTLEAAPAAHAATQNNLGTAHWDLALLPDSSVAARRTQYQAAIAAYEAAIAAVTHLSQLAAPRPALTFDVYATHNNLGLAYYQWAMDHPLDRSQRDRQTDLEHALQHHLRALQGWDAQSELHQTTVDFVVQTVRALFHECGIEGQNLALSQIPPTLLPQVMSKL